MRPRLSRLRGGELLAALAAVVLVLDLFALSWYSSGAVTASGWTALSVVRWLILATVALALGLAGAQATRRAPAVPASLSVLATLLGLLTAVVLLWRVLIDRPGPDLGLEAGAWIGLLSGLALFAGAVWSLREEDPADPERNAAIAVVPLP